MNNLVIVWLIIGMTFLLIELIHPYWVVFWFAVGAALAAIFSQQLSINGQILLFLASSLSLLYLGRPFIMKTIVPKRKITNTEALIGRVEEVFEEIDNNNKTGAIKIHGTFWNAISTDDHLKIKEGTNVKITNFDGLTVIVEPIKKGGKS